MRGPWRIATLALAWVLVAVAGPTWGQQDRSSELLRVYAEILALGHQRYGSEVVYRDLVRASINGAMRHLDPHSSFLAPRSYAGMRERQQGTYHGVGMLVSKRDGRLLVVSPIEGSPAWRKGLRAGDVITEVDGESVTGLSMNEAVGRIKGPKGTAVTLTVFRSGAESAFEVTIERAEIPQDTVRYAYMMDELTGYVRLTDFSRSSGREMGEALARLRAEGMQRLILDLRSNGGGLLDAAIEVAGLLVPPGSLVVGTQGRIRGSYQQLLAEGVEEELQMPLVVLVNRGTASAAEIVSGAVQDHDVGLVVGTPTWGKGLVQTVYSLSYDSGIALTTARYTTPSGRVIQRDYSDYYDYYSTGAATPEEGSSPSPSETFSTTLGRTVYGGGGITPDVLVEPRAGSGSLQRLYAWNAFFDFAVEFHDRHSVTRAWEPPSGWLAEFRDWLAERREISPAEAEELLGDEENRSFIERQIHSDLFNVAFDAEAAHRVLARGDAQIERALETFAEAADLLARRGAVPPQETRRRPEEAASSRPRRSATALPGSSTEASAAMPRAARATYEFLVAALHENVGDFGEALEGYRRSLELTEDPYSALALANLHNRLAARSRERDRARTHRARAVELAREARDLAPDNVGVLKEYGLLMLTAAQRSRDLMPEAQQALEKVRASRPGDVSVLVTLAEINRSLGRSAQALELLRDATSRTVSLRLDGQLAEALMEAGEYEEAEELLEELLLRRRESVALWLRLVEAHRRQNDYRAAVEAIRSAPAGIQEEPAIRKRLAEALRSLGESPP